MFKDDVVSNGETQQAVNPHDEVKAESVEAVMPKESPAPDQPGGTDDLLGAFSDLVRQDPAEAYLFASFDDEIRAALDARICRGEGAQLSSELAELGMSKPDVAALIADATEFGRQARGAKTMRRGRRSGAAPGGGAGSGSLPSPGNGSGHSGAPAATVTATGERPRIVVNGRHLRDIAEDAEKALVTANIPMQIFRSSNLLVRLSREGEFRLEPFTPATLSLHWSKNADWVRETMTKKGVISEPAFPTQLVVAAALNSPPESLPVVESVRATPFLGASGEIVSTPGYCASDRVYLRPDDSLVLPAVPPVPSAKEVADALLLLQEDLLGDFPFVTNGDRANMLAFIISAFVMPYITAREGTAPLIVLEAAVYGSGKTLLGNLVSLIALRTPMSWRSFAAEEAERQKAILTALIEGGAFVAFDNVKGEVGGESLEGALTTIALSGRLLGTNKDARVRNSAVWVMTSNNVTLSPDMVRRTVRVRIDARVEDPTKGRTFKHADIVNWTKTNRPSLVHAVLTLIQNWVARGRPDASGKPKASFEAWSKTLGGILECAGVQEFLSEDASLSDASSESGEALEFLEAWAATRHLRKDVSARELLNDLVAPPVQGGFGETRPPPQVSYLETVLPVAPSSRAARLGKWLNRNVDRVYGRFAIRRGGRDTHTKTGRYSIEELTGPDAVQGDQGATQDPTASAVAAGPVAAGTEPAPLPPVPPEYGI